MQARHPLIHGVLCIGLLVSATSSAQFHADPNNLKGSGLDANYGTYAPQGDCKREPRITVDDSGFTFRYGQHDTHPSTVATAAGYFGRQDTLFAFFPFPTGVTNGESGLQAADPGPLLIALDTQASTLTLSKSNPGVPLTPLQAALIKHSPYARCAARGAGSHATEASAATATATGTLTINFDKNAIKPTPAQDAAIKRAAGDDITQPLPGHAGEPLYALALADLNGDGRADLIVQYTYAAGACGSTGCSGIIVMATAQGYARKQIGLPNFTEIAVLPTMHRGMHDLQFDGDSPIWQWTGSQYDIPKADLPQSNMQPWKTAQAPGHPLMAYVTPIDSVIKRVFVACEQGRPLLMVLTKQPLPSGPATLTFVFRGWTVNAPLQRNDTNVNLWMADLSRSQLPYWFAHRGFDANSRQLAPLVTESYLRINGDMQGQISMQESTTGTRAALSGCYRY